jgi:hypothetical protein
VTDVRYAGPGETRLIADQTNPWVEVKGQPIDWLDASPLPPRWDGECEDCRGFPLPGVWAPMDTDEGIQRCDTCQVFEGDLAAAQALADLVGGVVMFELDEED